jgi:hypothetical protein
MQPIKLLLVFGTTMLLYSCAGTTRTAAPENINLMNSADSTKMDNDVSSFTDADNKNDSDHTFIRTADLKFKVKNVIDATTNIEDIINRQGGLVTYTNLNNTIDNSSTAIISADSTLETTYYTVTNTMTIRIPNSKLDTKLKQVAGFVDFLDSRTIKADDVILRLVSDSLSRKRYSKISQRLTSDIDKKGKKLSELTDVEDLLTEQQEQGDNAAIESLSLAEQVRFSIITLNLHQRQSIQQELIANAKNINVYKSGFGKQLQDAFTDGWEILESLFVIIAHFWGLWLLIIAVYFLYKANQHK